MAGTTKDDTIEKPQYKEFRLGKSCDSGSDKDRGRDSDSEDEDRYVDWKRVRTNNNLPDLVPAAASAVPDISAGNLPNPPPKSRKINTIWSDVTAEQDLTQNLSGKASVFVANGQNTIKRGPETYSVRKRPHPVDDRRHGNDRYSRRDQHGDHHRHRQNDNYVAKRVNKKPDESEIPTMTHGVVFDRNDSIEILGKKLASALREIKVDLMVKCAKILGFDKCGELYFGTSEIEKTGGMLTMDCQRRRTPGGTFLQLVREDNSITTEQRKELFQEQRDAEQKLAHARRNAKRKETGKDDNFQKLLSETKSKIVEGKSAMDLDTDLRDYLNKRNALTAGKRGISPKSECSDIRVEHEDGELMSDEN